VRDPLRSLQTNIQGTESVLEIAKELGLPLLVTSSSEVYGKNTSDRLSEDDDRVLGPTSIARWSYSEAKAIDEFLAISFHKEFSLPTRIVRLFNTVGPRQVGNYGMVIPRFVSSALKSENIEIYGTGEQTRCFTHVLDVIDALLLISNSDNTIGEVINIGNNSEITISNLAKKIISMTDSESEIVYKKYEEVYEKDFEDMQRRVPDISKIKRLTGWAPTRDLDSILLDVIAHEKNGR
jgi:UDP-glucose 4-epimerase